MAAIQNAQSFQAIELFQLLPHFKQYNSFTLFRPSKLICMSSLISIRNAMEDIFLQPLKSTNLPAVGILES